MLKSSTAAVIDALDQIDPTLGAFITVNAEGALRSAATAPEGRLAGMTIGVKDLIDVSAVRTTYGSLAFQDHIPAATAPSVIALEHQGAVVIGKTNLNEFAFGVSGYNPNYGPIITPGDSSLTAGGSSGGSAVAVATGACTIGVGTDTSGSVRIPAACCGIWGFKFAHGQDLTGIYPLAPNLDSLGYLARNPDDLELVLGIEEAPDIHSVSVGRIGEDVMPPPLPDEHWVLFRYEAWAVHGKAFTENPETFGKDLQRKLRVPIGDVHNAMRVMDAWRKSYAIAVRGFDILVQPVFEGGPPRLETVIREYEQDTYSESARLMSRTPIANALGWPALAFPGRDQPLEVLAPPGSESALFSVARSLQNNQ